MRKGYKQFHIHVPSDIAKKVKVIAIHEGVTMTDLLTEVLKKFTSCEKYREIFGVKSEEK